MKVSGGLKRLVKKIIYIKNMNLEADVESQVLSLLAKNNPQNYEKAYNKHLKSPWNRIASGN